MSELHRLTIAEAAPLIERRELSPVELTDACIARIGAVDGQLNAFISLRVEEARDEAQVAADQIASGAYWGPLHGIPVAIKDIFDVAGVRTTAASKILAESTADSDSAAVERLRAAGAIILGKLNLHEFAYGATGIDSHFGPARNAWNTDHVTGGSSSGSGTAVAGGECMAALGTDTGGSIRIPSSLCGIAGIKPTFGRVSRRGLLPLSWSLDHAGPMARSVEDCAIRPPGNRRARCCGRIVSGGAGARLPRVAARGHTRAADRRARLVLLRGTGPRGGSRRPECDRGVGGIGRERGLRIAAVHRRHAGSGYDDHASGGARLSPAVDGGASGRLQRERTLPARARRDVYGARLRAGATLPGDGGQRLAGRSRSHASMSSQRRARWSRRPASRGRICRRPSL